MPYPTAVALFLQDVRDDVVKELVHLIRLFGTAGPPRAGQSLWSLVVLLQVQCKELCASGLDYDRAEQFAMLQAGPDWGTWMEDGLFPDPVKGGETP